MNPLVLSTIEYVEGTFTRYELPPEGITTLGYLVRRMHKTNHLSPVLDMIQNGQYAEALHQVAFYAASAAVSFGTLYYEPQKDPIGTTITEKDPKTEAIVTATLEAGTPNEKYKYAIALGDESRFCGIEMVEESNFGIRGWTMPSTSRFFYMSAGEEYSAKLSGTITREIVPTIVGPWRSRAHGQLDLSDSNGNNGKLTLNRRAQTIITICSADSRTILHRESQVL